MERDFRATILDGGLRLVDWAPWLAGRGPSRRLLTAQAERHGLAILDLEVVRERDVAVELVAVPLAGDVERARPVLEAWAALVGYRRLWLPDVLVPLEPVCGAEVSATCTSCRAEFREDDGHFWQVTRMNGRFPIHCPFCGGDLPQWRTTRVRSLELAPTPVTCTSPPTSTWTSWPSSRPTG